MRKKEYTKHDVQGDAVWGEQLLGTNIIVTVIG